MPDSKGHVVWSVLVFFAVGGTLVSLLPMENRLGGVAQAGSNCATNSDCEDLYNCTVDSCVEGLCENVPVNASCDDGYACTIDFCDPFYGAGATTATIGFNHTLGCQHMPDDSFCDDGNMCAQKACLPFDFPCKDQLFCGNPESATSQLMGPKPDENGCAVVSVRVCIFNPTSCANSSCNPSTGECEEFLNHSLCDDGDACTEDICDPDFDNTGSETSGNGHLDSGCVFPHPPVNCSDGIGCTDDSCDKAEGCLNEANNSYCEDDGNECTDVICDPDSLQNATLSGEEPEQDGCVAKPIESECDNGSGTPCDAMDMCVDGSCMDNPDTDGDGICDPDDARPDDPDPSGYIYDEETGDILPGGLVTIVPAPGATGTVVVNQDGSNGMYDFVVNFNGGATTSGIIPVGHIYRLVVTAPPGCRPSSTCVAQPGALDPSGMANPVTLGSYPSIPDPGRLESADCADNDYYRAIRLQPGDPNVINNNFPMVCGPVPAPAVSGTAWWTAVLLMLAGVGFVALRRYAR